MSIPTNWYEDFFHGLSLDLWRKAIPPEQTKLDADFLVEALKCAPGSHLLDVPCGNGRLSLELASRGYQLTGVDISDEFIEEAKASTHAGGTPVPQFFLGDMRRIEGRGIYDGAYCFGNSFGFLAYADMETFLNGVARALKPGTRFVVETGMAAESIIPKFEAHASHQIQDILVTINEEYLAAESCVDSEYIFERAGEKEVRKAKHWIYTAAEIQRMLVRAGFSTLDVYGTLTREPYVLGADELFVVSEVRA
ncbi:MAG: class I SAM-dependent methyltransferase [Acidobacteriota bacterium]